jgi:hypothetical protein
MQFLPVRASILAATLFFLSATGVIHAQTVVWSNLDAPPTGYGSALYSGGTVTVAMQSFMTGDTATELDNITLAIASTGQGTGFSLGLYSAGAGVPGALLETLSGSTSPTIAGQYSFVSESSFALSANTTYWWVASVEPAGNPSFHIGLALFSSLESDEGWSIGQGYYSTIQPDDSFGSLSSFGGRSFRFSVSTVSAIPEPSIYAVFAGLGALAFVIWRRRSGA